MSVALNHTIVHADDRDAAAAFIAEILGLPAPKPFGPFKVVETGNGVSLDYIASGGEKYDRQHYAFLVSDAAFEDIFGRVKARGLEYWADPMGKQLNEINTHFGGRGFYFRDLGGHWMEVITRPYGAWDDHR